MAAGKRMNIVFGKKNKGGVFDNQKLSTFQILKN